MTGNAAAGGLGWSMQPLLPAQGGLDINGVLYRYTTVKDPSAALTVAVRNEDAINGGYIFSETDDWSGLPGNTITKSVPVNNIPSAFWGAGSIDVQGQGSVENASVRYSYRIDECFNPQASPTCEGYIPPISTYAIGEVYDPLDDVSLISEKVAFEEYDEEDAEVSDDEDERKKRLERSLALSESALSMLVPQQAMLDRINGLTNITPYYSKAIDGGAYPEPIEMTDADLPDNKRGLRNNLAQQRLHDKMVEMQYAR